MDSRYETQKDNFSALLPMYLSTDIKDNKGGAFQPIIEKAKKTIQEHSIQAKPRREAGQKMTAEYRKWLEQEEFNPFLKNVWLLMGKAQVENGQYTDALATFSQILRMYKNDTWVINESLLWMVRIYTELEWFSDAENTVIQLRSAKIDRQQQRLFDEFCAYLKLRSFEWNQALPYLEKAIKNEKNRQQRYRLRFLSAQMYDQLGESSQAKRAFRNVIDLSVPTLFRIHSLIQQTALSQGKERADMTQQLLKLAQSPRYHEFGYDLYSAVAQNYTLQNDTANANKYLAEAQKFPPPVPVSQPDIKEDNEPFESAYFTSLSDSVAVAHDVLQAVSRTDYTQDVIASDNREQKNQADSTLYNAAKHIPSLVLYIPEYTTTDAQNRLLFATANYNFSTFELRTFGLSFLKEKQIDALQIKGFNNFAEASDYVKSAFKDSTFVREVNQVIVPLIISEENWEKLKFSNQSIETYQRFYAENLSKELPQFILPETLDITEAEPIHEIQPIEVEPTKIVTTPIAKEEKRDSLVSIEQQMAEKEALLEQKEKEALQHDASVNKTASGGLSPREREKERQRLLKQKEKERVEQLRQRERELKERKKQRDEEIKRREKEREQLIREREQKRKQILKEREEQLKKKRR